MNISFALINHIIYKLQFSHYVLNLLPCEVTIASNLFSQGVKVNHHETSSSSGPGSCAWQILITPHSPTQPLTLTLTQPLHAPLTSHVTSKPSSHQTSPTTPRQISNLWPNLCIDFWAKVWYLSWPLRPVLTIVSLMEHICTYYIYKYILYSLITTHFNLKCLTFMDVLNISNNRTKAHQYIVFFIHGFR